MAVFTRKDRKRTARVLGALALAAVLVGCGAEGGAAPGPAGSPPPVPAASRPSRVEGRLGELTYAAQVTPLSGEQEAAILDFLDSWYAALARLGDEDFSALLSDPDQARANESALAVQVALRTMTEGVDYSLTGCSYVLTCTQVRCAEGGAVQVSALEASCQNFAQFPGVDSLRGSNEHQFILERTGDGWRLAGHMQYDTLCALLLEQGVEPEELTPAYAGAAQDYLARLRAAHARREEERGLALSLPEAEHPYDRQAALDYADAYAMARSPEWVDYSDYGGNCQNFASQCLYAGGIPMDTTGDAVWKWYGSTPSQTPEPQGRSASWTAVGSFRAYARDNTGFGLASQVDAPYYAGRPGDLIQMGDEESWAHTVVIRQLVQNEAGETADYLIHSNTNDMANYPASLYGYPALSLIAVAGWNG